MTEHTKDADDLQKLLDEATPGPWVIGPDETGEPAQCVTGGGFDIATIWGGYNASYADARLIAMAPNLAAALILAKEALTALVDEYCDYATINHLGDPERQHNIKRARAALDAVNALEPPK